MVRSSLAYTPKGGFLDCNGCAPECGWSVLTRRTSKNLRLELRKGVGTALGRTLAILKIFDSPPTDHSLTSTTLRTPTINSSDTQHTTRNNQTTSTIVTTVAIITTLTLMTLLALSVVVRMLVVGVQTLVMSMLVVGCLQVVCIVLVVGVRPLSG